MIFKQCAIAKLNKSFFAGYNTDRIARFWMIIRICNQKCVTELAKKLVSVKKNVKMAERKCVITNVKVTEN